MRRLATLALVMILLGGSASGDVFQIKDPRDFSEPYDIVAAWHGHASSTSGSVLLRHTIRTKERWRKEVLICNDGLCHDLLVIHFDLDGDRKHDRAAYVFAKRDRRLRGEIFRHAPKSPCHGPRYVCGRRGFIGPVHVWRPDRRSVVIRIEDWKLRAGITSYGWRTEAIRGPVGECHGDIDNDPSPDSGSGPNDGRVPEYCTDRAPRRGFVQHSI